MLGRGELARRGGCWAVPAYDRPRYVSWVCRHGAGGLLQLFPRELSTMSGGLSLVHITCFVVADFTVTVTAVGVLSRALVVQCVTGAFKCDLRILPWI